MSFSSRFEHTHIVGGSGHGKTQLLQMMILRDIERLVDGEGATIIVIDSQGDLLKNIMSLGSIRRLSERLVLIDPTDIDNPPALNLFDFGLERLDRYSALEREKLLNGAIALYEYLFGALLGAELTQKQGVIFRYLGRLMMAVPGATIRTLMSFMEDPETTRRYLAALDGTSRHFFESQFFSKAFDNTRQQILTRLWGVLSNAVLDRMFSSERNNLDLFESMNRGGLILINTAKDLLKQDGCEILGRFFIALITQAAQERAAIAAERRRSTFVYIDEAQDYFDESIGQLFNQARKYKVGLIIAHQNLDQFDQKLRAAVLASTSIKLVGGLSAKDAAIFAKEMNCEPEFLQNMRKARDSTQFACFVRNQTRQPVCLTVAFGQMEKQQKLTTDELENVLAENRRRYSAAGERISLPERAEGNRLSQPDFL
jgi:type IV secretory pathway VirB4 component